MSRWSDQFEIHAIHETLKQIREWAYIEIEGIDSEHEAEQRRMLKMLDTIKGIVDGIDPEFFPEPELTQLNNHMRHQSFWNELSTYASDGNVSHLRTANDHMNSQVPKIYQLGGLSKQPEVQKTIKAVEDAYDCFCQSIEKAKNDFSDRLDENDQKLTEFNPDYS